MLDYLPRPIRKTARKLRRRLTGGRLEVVYHEQYNHAFTDIPSDALRAERIVAFLAAEGLVLRRHVHRPEPVSLKALERVHTAEYLDSLHDPSVVTSIVGSEVPPAMVDRLIDFQRLQVGGTLSALRRARKHSLRRGLRAGVAANLGGGYHHAHPDRGGGFCLFNDVAVAVSELRRSGSKRRVLVVDLDLHDGDGTRAFFAQDETVHTFSIHARHWSDDQIEAAESTAVALGDRVGDEDYLAALEKYLPPVFDRYRPQLVFYLAGSDPAKDDVLGDWRISARAMLQRDRRVCQLTQQTGAPLVILLAGGYGDLAWRYTARFLSDLEQPGQPVEPPPTEVITLKRYRYLASFFDPSELSGGASTGGDNEFGLTDEDLMLPGWSGGRETRFLGFYSRHGVELVLERTGFLDRLRDLGFTHPTLEFQLDDPGGQTVRIFGDLEKTELLCELRLGRDRRTLPGIELLSVEWLLMQNPRAEFSANRPRLPGQQHPGLGMLGDLVALLIVACERLHLDGLVFVPSQFHVAAYGSSHMHFLHPETQDRFEALLGFFRSQSISFAEATQAVAKGLVVDEASGRTIRWHPEPMVLPVSRRLQEKAREVRSQTPRSGSLRLRWQTEITSRVVETASPSGPASPKSS
ncbi:MAG: histone deacetylase [Thermoanaerobaculia bacterium]|nr:histone deacetylase [Thermoanaerobaculia bacterium]